MSNVMWVNATGGSSPAAAVAQGHEADGTPLFLARAAHEGGIHIGKVRAAFGAANIPYGGEEIKVNPYEVLVGSGTFIWVAASGGQVPDGAVALGREKDGTPLFAARAQYEGGVHLGKVRLAFGAANIPYGGKEVKVKAYEVLVWAK